MTLDVAAAQRAIRAIAEQLGLDDESLAEGMLAIVNAKMGVRVGIGPVNQPGNQGRLDLYAGYGRALTGDFWYKDIMRFELRMRF